MTFLHTEAHPSNNYLSILSLFLHLQT